MKSAQYLFDNGKHAHAIANTVRGHQQKVALPLRLQQHRTKLRLIKWEYGCQLKLALTPEVILLYPWKDSQRNLWRTILFVVQAISLLTDECAQCRMLSLHSSKRQPDPLGIDVALQS